MRPVVLVIIAVIAFLQYEIWFGHGSFYTAWGLRQSISAQAEKNFQLQQRNEILAADIKDLKNGNQAVEERARNELGMVKKDEIFYQASRQMSVKH